MPREIVWLPGAVRDIDRLRSFLKSDNPRAAQRAAQRIIEGVKLLQANAEAGIPVENLIDYRDLILSFGAGNYIVRYCIETTSRVVIVRVCHSKEQQKV